ncbi:PH domain-containing protein [Nocardioides bigeumensis]|uniref:Low molecular weight protein antigen 6 PH domain-containing protein n=1 Tax=Nocardioides bigeumensis TaxID=433657 RepID=A0ABN2Y5E3_9ACTN
MSLPHTWRPLGVRMASLIFGAGLLAICAMAWVGLDQEIRDVFTVPQRLTLLGLGLMIVAALHALSRSRVTAEVDRVVVVNGYRRRVFDRHAVVAVSMGRGAPWATLDLDDGSTVPVMGIQGSDGDRARVAVRELRAVLDAP